jgi:hypothetical protein
MAEIKTTKAFHDQVNHATDFETLRATCLNEGRAQGLIAHSKDGLVELRTPTAPDKKNAAGQYQRVIYAGGHYVELTGTSPEQLDTLENIVRMR